MKENSVLEMRNIHKSFPGVRALQAVDFTLCEGEIHALMGENGAGKSTLIKVLTGVYEKDEGEIYLKGLDKAAAIKSPKDAQNLGISTVYQEITLCPNPVSYTHLPVAVVPGILYDGSPYPLPLPEKGRKSSEKRISLRGPSLSGRGCLAVSPQALVRDSAAV